MKDCYWCKKEINKKDACGYFRGELYHKECLYKALNAIKPQEPNKKGDKK